MNKFGANKGCRIHPEMTVLDVVGRYRQAESVFRKYDEQAGVCICCEVLFEPIRDVAARYGLDQDKLLTDLESVADILHENLKEKR